MYRMLDDNGWSEPVDLVIRDTWATSYPQVFLGPDTAYLIWSEWGGLYMSQAPLWDMNRVASWTPKQRLSDHHGIGKSRIVGGQDGTLHIVYTRLGTAGYGDGNLYYLTNENGEWSLPIQVSQIADPRFSVTAYPNLAIDKDGILHAVWVEVRDPEWRGHAIYYANKIASLGGWSIPQVLSERVSPEDRWEDAPSMVVDQKGVVHLVWVCGENAFRCYRYSIDKGNTWSSPERILNDMVSLAGWDSLLVDEKNQLHLVAQLRMPNNVYHVMKPQGQPWGKPVPIVSLSEAFAAHYPQATLAPKNRFYVVMQPDSAGPIWYAAGLVPSDNREPLAVPTGTPSPTPVLPQPLSLTEEPTREEILDTVPAAGEKVEASALKPVIWAIVSSVLIVGGVALWAGMKQR